MYPDSRVKYQTYYRRFEARDPTKLIKCIALFPGRSMSKKRSRHARIYRLLLCVRYGISRMVPQGNDWRRPGVSAEKEIRYGRHNSTGYYIFRWRARRKKTINVTKKVKGT